MNVVFVFCTVSNVKFFVKDFFSKCEIYGFVHMLLAHVGNP